MAMANTSPITDYYGPRALFDPSFIPPELHGRDKELHQVTSFLRDSQEDEFAANLAICGLPGMGKSTLVGRALSDLEYGQVVDVDCRNKIVEEILGALISGTEASLLPEFSGLNVLHKGIPNLWNTLRLIVKKTVSKSKNMTIVLKSINYIEDGYFEKFCRFGKEMGVNILATWENYGFLNETKPLQGGDFRTTLRPLSCSDLHRMDTGAPDSSGRLLHAACSDRSSAASRCMDAHARQHEIGYLRHRMYGGGPCGFPSA